MKLNDYIRILAGIGDDATKVLHKKIGKTKGLDSIEKQIRDEATSAAEKSFGGDLDRVAQVHINRYVAQRMKYMKKAFTKLDNPKTDTSKQRGENIGDNESHAANEFGKFKGFERLSKSKDKTIFKDWVPEENPCDECSDNADDGSIPIDEEFSSGAMSPADAHPGCQCHLEYSDEDGNEIDLDDEEGED
jgi:hypothetical protein